MHFRLLGRVDVARTSASVLAVSLSPASIAELGNPGFSRAHLTVSRPISGVWPWKNRAPTAVRDPLATRLPPSSLVPYPME